MALQYGLNFPVSNIKQLLEQNDTQQSGVRSWRQLLGGASLGYNAQTDALTTDYSAAMAQAYKANFEQNANIMGSGISAGGTKQLLSMSRQDLQNTYDTYIRNYAQNISSAAENYGEEVELIDTALTERATNISNTLKSLKDYYSTEISADYLKENYLNWLLYTDEEAAADTSKLTIAGTPRTTRDIEQLLFDETGALTDYGKEFISSMTNAMPQKYMTQTGERMRSFDEFLSDTNPELREWFVSEDPFNYTTAGSNRGTFNVMTGSESTQMARDTEKSIIIDAKGGGYAKMLENINTRLGENRLSNIKDLERAYKGSYNVRGGDAAAGAQSQNIDGVMSSYKDLAKTEIDTFKEELNSLLGKDLADDFWKQYGKTVDDLYKQVVDWKTVNRAIEYKYDATSRNYKNVYAESLDNFMARKIANFNKMKALGLDKALEQLYKDLGKYINK